MHDVHALDSLAKPAVSPNLPASQEMQLEEELLPTSSLYLPAGQSVQARSPAHGSELQVTRASWLQLGLTVVKVSLPEWLRGWT